MVKVGKTKKYKGFPSGCGECHAAQHSTKESLEWQCKHGCLWPDNYWKYNEVSFLMHLYKQKQGGADLMKLELLSLKDYEKISILSNYLDK